VNCICTVREDALIFSKDKISCKSLFQTIYSFSAALELCSRDSERGRRMQLVLLVVGGLVGGLVGKAAAQCSPSPCGVNTQCDVNPAGAAVCRSEFYIHQQRVAKRCRLPWLTNSALEYEPKCGGGGCCGVSANECSCAAWSPNKLWRSNSIFNLWHTPSLIGTAIGHIWRTVPPPSIHDSVPSVR
jgi:hypothetical protein